MAGAFDLVELEHFIIPRGEGMGEQQEVYRAGVSGKQNGK